jgi:dipeptidyl aminopeptidase/acylaminoacyl peptidase
MRHLILLPVLLLSLFSTALLANERTLNNGNLILQDIPDIPLNVKDQYKQYQNVRSATFQSWSADGKEIFVQTRFGEVSQLHRVTHAGGARTQLTFHDEPLGAVTRDPKSDRISFTMDAGGSEFSQIFLLESGSGQSRMLTDGESRNHSVTWTPDGTSIAYTSTARNGRSNDIWMMEVDEPEPRRLVFQSPDGTSWGASDFSKDGSQLLLTNYVSVTDSRIHLKNLREGTTTLLKGGDESTTTNYAVGFDADAQGFYFVTDQDSEFLQLAWAPIDNPSNIKRITSGINWNIEDVILSDDKSRAAFVINAGGISELYLLDTKTLRFEPVTNIPIGVIGKAEFRHDGRALGLTINTPKTPSDTFVLALGTTPTSYGELTRWTFSEVGGLDTETFIEPTLVEFESFDGRSIPAFYYQPEGEGPFPVVVSIHGGPESQSRPRFSSTYQMWLKELGIAVLVPNVRGSNGYGREYVQLDNGMRREDSVRDIGALLDWIQTQPQLDENRVAVFGGSYGGYMVLASAVHFSDRLKAAVDIVGISNFVTFLENTQDYRRDLRRVEYGDERIPEMRAFLEKISPLNNISKIRVPLFVVQGQNDPRVPVTEAEQIVKALRQQDQTVWYMNALNEGHGYARKENSDIYRQATVLFLKQHLIGN